MTEEEEFEFRLRYEGEQKPDASGWQEYEPVEVKSGWIKGLKDPIQGAAQLAYNLSGARETEPPIVSESGLDLNTRLAEEESLYQKGRKVEGDEGIDWDRMGGSAISTLIPGVAGYRAAAPITKLGRLGASIGSGAGYGAVTPVYDKDCAREKKKQIALGAGFGAVLPGFAWLGKKGAHMADEFTKPLYHKGIQRDSIKFAREHAGSERDKILQAVHSAKQGQTSGQAIAQANTPGAPFGGQLVKLEQELAKEPITGTQLRGIYGGQVANREKIINAIAGTSDDMASAVTTRANVTRPLYKAVEESRARVDVEPVIKRLYSIQAKNKNETAVSEPIKKILNKILPDGKPESNPQALYSLSKELKTMMGKTTPGGQKEYNVQVLDEIRKILNDQIGKSESAFKHAQSAYRSLSKPINQMQVGQELKKALINPSEKEAATTFLGAVRNAPRTIKRSTGFNRYEELGDVLNPQQVSGVKKVSEALINKTKADTLASGTRSIMKDLPGEITTPLPRILSRPIVLTNHLLGMLGKDKSPEYKAVLTEMLKDPKNLEKALKEPFSSARAKMAKDIMREIVIYSAVKSEQQGAN